MRPTGSGPPEDGVRHRQELVRAPRTELEAAALSPEDAEPGLEHVDGGDHEATAQELPRLDREGRGADDGALLVGGRRDFDLLDPQLEMPRGAVPGERRPTHTDRRSDRRAERRLDAWHEDPERNGRLHQTPGEQPDRSHGEPSERERPPPPEHEVEPYATGGVVSASGRPGRCASRDRPLPHAPAVRRQRRAGSRRHLPGDPERALARATKSGLVANAATRSVTYPGASAKGSRLAR